jgi:tetratricopeptide (TPR) repeat protein
MGSSSQLKADAPMYVSGFPKMPGDSVATTYQFSEGELGAISTRPIGSGYALAYLTDTFAGMSGGAILNQQGQLVGIHGSRKTRFSDNEGIDPTSGLKEGLNLGIPIDTFLRLVAKVNPALKFPTAPPLAAPSQPTASDLALQAANQFIAGKPKEALSTIEEAIRLQPNYASAYNSRAVSRGHIKDFRGSIADSDQAIRLDPTNAVFYFNRGQARGALNDWAGALADLEKTAELLKQQQETNPKKWVGLNMAKLYQQTLESIRIVRQMQR